jgi:DNA polymerase I
MGARVQFFPLDISYKEVDGRPVIYLYGTTAEGKQICVTDSMFEPYFYALPKEGAELAGKIEKIEVEGKRGSYRVTRTEVVTKKLLGEQVTALRIVVNLPRAVPAIKEVIGQWDSIAALYEYDIQYVRRYLIDKGITPMTLLEAEVEPATARTKVPVFKAKSVEQFSDDTLTAPRILAFDIETYNPLGSNIDTGKNPIIMIGFYGKNYRKVYTWKRFRSAHKYVEFVNSEAELIERFKEVLDAYKPDVITGYFSDGFDLPYIMERAKKYKIRLDVNLDYTEMRARRGRRITTQMSGIVHLDLLSVIRRTLGSTMATDSYSLNSVAEEVLGERKHEVRVEQLAQVWDNSPEELDEFCAYNLKDAELTYRLCQKLLPQIIEMVKIVGLPMVDVATMGFSQLVEWYLLRQAPGFNELAPNKPGHDLVRERRGQSYKGAFVYEPKPGRYKDIVIFDFRSLYPTIISSHNISHETMDCSCCRDTAEHVPGDGSHWFCTKKRGFIPIVIDDLITRRMRIKEMMKDSSEHTLLRARQDTLKLLANSFYGYLGFFAARWYNLECARSVTAYGRHYIQRVIERAQKEDFKVLYSDTDSIFILLEHEKQDTTAFIEGINRELPGLMELEYEGFYPAGLFVSVKAGATGAKKKYALVDDSGSLRIKGFEAVRRNWSFIAKEAQRRVIEIVLKEDDTQKALQHVRKVIADLRENRVSLDRVVIHTQLQKHIEEYDAVGPHVKAAMRMKNRGIDVQPGAVIEFVVVKGKGRVGDRVRLIDEAEQSDYDSGYYINNQLIPSVERIFQVLGVEPEELVASKDQKKLEGFFG